MTRPPSQLEVGSSFQSDTGQAAPVSSQERARSAVPARQIFLQVGDHRYQLASYAQASQMFCMARDQMGEGASNTPSPQLVDEHGNAFGYVSYNGRVWEGDLLNWSNETTKLLYCPNSEPCPYTRIRAVA